MCGSRGQRRGGRGGGCSPLSSSQPRALELYDTGLLGTFEIGTFAGLAKIHGYLFQDVYELAGELRTVNISKGGFRFASVMYLGSALGAIDGMPQSTFDQIVEKYVEMNVAHPFREGNGRSMRIWLDCMLRERVVASEALTDAVADRQIYMKGIDASYRYEGYAIYSMDELDR